MTITPEWVLVTVRKAARPSSPSAVRTRLRLMAPATLSPETVSPREQLILEHSDPRQPPARRKNPLAQNGREGRRRCMMSSSWPRKPCGGGETSRCDKWRWFLKRSHHFLGWDISGDGRAATASSRLQAG